MGNWKKATVRGLVILMLLLPLHDLETSLEAATLFGASSVKQEVGQFGVGAKVKVKLAGGEKLYGSIEALEDGGFLLNTGKTSTPRLISYGQVAQVKLAKLTYNAPGQPDPLEVRRVITALGAGKHIMVKTTGKREDHGNIQAIEQDYFTIFPDRQTIPVQIAYSEVSATGPNLSTAAKVVIGVVIGVVIFAAIVAAKTCNAGWC